MGVNRFEASGLQIEPKGVQMGQAGAINNFGLQAAAPEISVATPPSPSVPTNTRNFGA